MDIKPVGNNNAQPGQRVSETGNFNADIPSVAARQSATPVQTVNAVQQSAQVPDLDKLNDALKNINQAVKALSPNLEFSVDSESNRSVVKIVDHETKEVIRQMPTPEALEIAKALDRLQGLLIRQKV
ncbi:MAG: flagellar protein FlaG [Burkholderiales bacterium]